MNLSVTFGYVKVCYSMLKFLYISSQGEEEEDGKAPCPPKGGGDRLQLRVLGREGGNSEETYINYIYIYI